MQRFIRAIESIAFILGIVFSIAPNLVGTLVSLGILLLCGFIDAFVIK